MNWKKIVATITLFAFVASCKPVGTDNAELMGAKQSATEKWQYGMAKCELACAKIKNKAVLAFIGGEEPAAESEVKFGDAKILWSFARYLQKRKARKDVKVTEKKDAGTTAPLRPADKGAKTTTGPGFFSKHFAVSNAGLVMSTSNNIRDILKTEGTAADKLQVASAKEEEKKDKHFWKKASGDKGPKLTTAQKTAATKQVTAALKAQTEALKIGSKLWKAQGGGGASFSFSAALDKFKKTEKMRVATDVEIKTVGAKLTAEAWLGAKVLNVGVGGAKFLQLIAQAGMDAPSVTKVNANADLRLLFFGIDVPGVTKNVGATLIDKAFPTPAIPKAQIPIYGFPGGGIVVEVQFIPTTGLGIDVDVKKGGMFTISFIPSISLVLSVTVGAAAAVLTIGVEGTTTILQMDVPLSVTMGGDIKAGVYYTGINYVGVKFTALGGTGISLVAKLDIPSPFNYVLWGILTVGAAVGLKLPGELGFGANDYKYAYPLWEPEFKLEVGKATKRAGPRLVKLPAKPTAAQCTALKKNVDTHLDLLKKEVDTKKDPILTAIDKGQNDMMNQIQKAVMGKCKAGGTAAGGKTTTPAKPAAGKK